MRIKMYRSKNRANDSMKGLGNENVIPPQDLYGTSRKSGKGQYFMRETFTMYSRPSAFGPPLFGGDWPSASYACYVPTSQDGRFKVSGSGALWGYNWAYTPPYYHGDAWCDLIFECTESKKYTAEEILTEVQKFPYYTRFWWNGTNDALRDLTGYRSDAWKDEPATVAGPSYNIGGYFYTADRAINATKGVTVSPAATYTATQKQAPIQGDYRNYYNSPWHNLISRGQLEAIGPYIPSLGNCPNYNLNSTIVPPGGFPDTTLIESQVEDGANYIRARWGTRYNMDGYKQLSGAWAGPPATEQIDNAATPVPGLPALLNAPYHPYYLNSNALQLNSTMNLFGLGEVRTKRLDGYEKPAEVATAQTSQAKSRWIIQPKFETPMLNFNKYSKLENCTKPAYANYAVPRGMWHQYGEIPEDEKTGVFYQVEDIPKSWFKGALGINQGTYKRKVRSLADLVGMPKAAVKLGQVADVKQIGECVVAVPFYEEDGERRFFTIPRSDIDETISALRREVEPGVFCCRWSTKKLVTQ